MAAISSCSSGSNNPSGPSSGSQTTSGDIFGMFYFVNTTGLTTGGTVTLDGGNPVTLTFAQAGGSAADPRIYQKIPNGTHSVVYTDVYGGSVTCSVDLGKVEFVTAFTVIYKQQ